MDELLTNFLLQGFKFGRVEKIHDRDAEAVAEHF